ncbi:MAG: hypothetical protein R3362_08725 [Rhodothermales bacterium]|nr:hypothetical protein [Rhodothermales bacterium]
MTPALLRRSWPALLLLGSLLLARPGAAQTCPGGAPGVDVPPYELVYLEDLIAIPELEFLPGLQQFAVCYGSTSPAQVSLLIESYLEFQGQEELIGRIRTVPLPTPVYLTAADLVESSSLVFTSAYNQSFVDELLEFVGDEGVPVAQAGQYRVVACVDPPTASCEASETPRASGVTEVRYESTAEALAIPLSPADGAQLATRQPFFQWLLPRPDTRVRFRLYRREAYHLSPEEALDAPPIFEGEFNGVSEFLYGGQGVPLEPGYTYYWLLDVVVFTSSGDEVNSTAVRSFSIAEETAAPSYLLDLLYQFGGEVPPTLDQLAEEGWQPDGTFLLDGRPISTEELARIAPEVRVRFGPAQAGVTDAGL